MELVSEVVEETRGNEESNKPLQAEELAKAQK